MRLVRLCRGPVDLSTPGVKLINESEERENSLSQQMLRTHIATEDLMVRDRPLLINRTQHIY